MTVTTTAPTVIVIDDDPEIREALGSLIRSVGFQPKLLASVAEFLKSGRPEGPSCLVLDVRLPGQSGFDLQRELAAMHIQLPTIFITGHGDIPMSVRAMKGGAIEFLTKPFREQDLLDAIQLGLERDRAWIEEEKVAAGLRARFETLNSARARSDGSGRGRTAQQAGRLRSRHQRSYGEGSPRAGYAKDESFLFARLGSYGGQAAAFTVMLVGP